MTKDQISNEFRALQDRICKGLESLDGQALFSEDVWSRQEGGGGRTRTLKSGDLLEKGGVAFSEVFGPVTTEMKQQLKMEGEEFYATGVSIVLHPYNPHVPIIHMNVRYFQLDDSTYWFGGGIDLTPHYIVPENAAKFHQQLKLICDRYDLNFYTEFKAWADTYFFLPHRGESRGIGGIFFDHRSEKNTPLPKEQLAQFCIDLGDAFVPIYSEQVHAGRNKSFTAKEIEWRNMRRGRYVEFNLVHDRGTKFGLHSGGRTESILMSLPPYAQWEYMYEVETESPEAVTLAFLREKIDWIS